MKKNNSDKQEPVKAEDLKQDLTDSHPTTTKNLLTPFTTENKQGIGETNNLPESTTIFGVEELKVNIFKILPLGKILKEISLVSKDWNSTLAGQHLFHIPGITDKAEISQKEQLKNWILSFPFHVQVVLLSLSLNQISIVSQLLKKNNDERKAFIKEKFNSLGGLNYRLNFTTEPQLYSDLAIIAFGLNIISPTQYAQSKNLITLCYALAILVERLLSFDQLRQLTEEQRAVISKNGIYALRNGLIKYEDLAKSQTIWRSLLTNNGLELLKDGSIALKDAILLNKTIKNVPLKQIEALVSPEGIKIWKEAKNAGLLKSEDLPLILPLDALLSDKGLTALKESLITAEQAKLFEAHVKANSSNLHVLLSDGGFVALREKLVTVEQAAKFDNLHGDLSTIFSQNGLCALREKLFTWDQFVIISRLKNQQPRLLMTLLSDAGLIFLRAKVIDFNTLIILNHHTLRRLVDSALGIKMLQEGLLKAKHFKEGLCTTVGAFLSPFAYEAFKENLFSADDMIKNQLKRSGDIFAPLMSEIGLKAIRLKLLSISDVMYGNLDALVTNNGITALSEKLITPEQANKFSVDPYTSGQKDRRTNLHVLLSDSKLVVLREKLMTPEQAARFPSTHLFSTIISGNGLIVLREKLITPDQLVLLCRRQDHSFFQAPPLPFLLSDNGITLLRAKVLDIDKVIKMNCSKLRFLFLSPNSLELIKNKFLDVNQMEQLLKPETLEAVVSTWSLIGLKEGLFTVNEIIQTEKKNYACDFRKIISQEGIAAFREKQLSMGMIAECKDLNALYQRLQPTVQRASSQLKIQ